MIVIVTHNRAQACRIAADVVVYRGRDGSGGIIEQGPAKRVIETSAEPTASANLADLPVFTDRRRKPVPVVSGIPIQQHGKQGHR
ncbi:MAG: hypothetical protein R3C59_00815 [Planctomycetaceae bacterium]